MAKSFLALAAALGAVQLGTQAVSAAMRALFGIVREGIRLAGVQEAANQKVATALERVGIKAEEGLPKIKQMSSALQDLTGFGDEMIETNQALLISMGKLTGEGLERATKASLDLGAFIGNQKTAFDLVAKASVGYTSTLSRYGIIIDNTGTKQEKFVAALEKIEELFGGEAESQLRTFTGRLRELNGRWDDLREAVGLQVTPILREFFGQVLSPGLKDLTQWINDSDALTKKIAGLAIIVVQLALGFEKLRQVISQFSLGEFEFLDIIAPNLADAARAVGALSEKWATADENISATEERLTGFLATLRAIQAGEIGANFGGARGGGGGDAGDGDTGGLPFGLDAIVGAGEELKKLEDAYRAIFELKPQLTQEQFAAALDIVRAKSQELSELGFAPLLGSMTEITAQGQQVRDLLQALAEDFGNVGELAAMMAQATFQSGAALLTAAASGEKANVSFKRVLKNLAQTSFAQSLYEFALGVAATTPWGRGIWGPPGPHFKSAAIFGAAGAAFGVAAGAVGGGGGGSASSGDVSTPTPPDTPPTEGGRRVEIQIFFEGQGIFADQEVLARELAESMTRQLGRAGVVS